MSRKDGVLALLVVVVWGLNFVVIKVGLHNMPPLMLAGLRFMLVAFPAIFFVARPKVPLNLLLGYGLTISFAQFAFLFCAINFGMPAGLASLVLQAQAFFTIVLGAFTFGERLHGKQLAGIGDQRKYVTAIIIPAYEALKEYAAQKQIQYRNLEELVKNQKIQALISERIDALQKNFARFEQIKRFTLLPQAFSMEKGELTNTLKIRRSVINLLYKDEIEAMYA